MRQAFTKLTEEGKNTKEELKEQIEEVRAKQQAKEKKRNSFMWLFNSKSNDDRDLQ